MKVRHLNVEIILEFNTIQPITTDLSDLKEKIKESMVSNVPKGCKLKAVNMRETKTEDLDHDSLMRELAKEYKNIVENNTNVSVNKILEARNKENKPK